MGTSRPGSVKRPLMRPTSCSTWARSSRYSRISPRLGTATWTNVIQRAQLRTHLEQQLDRAEPLRDPLRVVEPVDAEQEPTRRRTARCRPASARSTPGLVRAVRRRRPASIEIGCAAVRTTRPSCSRTTVPSTRTSSSSCAHVRRKLPRYRCVWKETTSAPSIPSSTLVRQGSRANTSGGGNGMWRKNPIRPSDSRAARSRPGSRSRW